MYIYAVQVDPEIQESPLDNIGFADYYDFEDIIIAGNREYYEIKNPMYEDIIEACDLSVADELEDIKNTQAQIDYVKDIFGNKYDITYGQLEQIYAAFCKDRTLALYRKEDLITDLLTALSGKKYACKTIRGSVQREYQFMYYPIDDMWEETLENIEIEYFNTGYEYQIYKSEKRLFGIEEIQEEDDCPDYFYGHKYGPAEQVKEIANAYLVDPENVRILIFDGYIKTPTYKTVIFEGGK